MSDILKDELEKLRKELEKMLIRGSIAPASVQTSETKKALVKSMGESRIARLKESSSSYMSNFQLSAKGAWVTKAKDTFESTSKKWDNVYSE